MTKSNMGTNALIKFRTINNGEYKEYMVVYFQHDGYPEGVAYALIKFIQSKDMVNGYDNKITQFNGFECLIAQYIAKFKDGAGNMYIYPINTVMNEDYNYYLTFNEETKEFTINMNNADLGIDVNKFVEEHIKHK
jgi:hypothetical protein